MTKIRTFSRRFPSRIHKNTNTFFVEKILNGIGADYTTQSYYHKLLYLNEQKIKEGKLDQKDISMFMESLNPDIKEKKFHTIRAGFSIKPNEHIQPAVWSDTPYNSPMIKFWEPLLIVSLQKFENIIQGHHQIIVDGKILEIEDQMRLAKNDGLFLPQLKEWFNTECYGQILCWEKGIVY